jgi:L-ribulose-5-phosphate 4-epimerase
MTNEEIAGDYEKETGKVIIETFREKKIDMMSVPGVLVYSHGPFAWEKDPIAAVKKAVILEEIALMAYNTQMLCKDKLSMQQELLDKHYLRKHGANAYYGQSK